MLHLSILVGLFILYGTVLSEHVISHFNGGFQHYVSPETNHASRIRRFGFTQLNELRQHFCHSFCKSADTMPYLLNLLCAAKCPELYLPHHTTQSTTAESISTPIGTTSSNLVTLSGMTGQSGPASNTIPPSGSSTSGTSQSGASSSTIPSSGSSTSGTSQTETSSSTTTVTNGMP
ncbi:PREDICTED: protein SLG1-like [Acromyrmex echinatior]|uniref:protein SLG1-like n=1 Tax=Acromyrmex echinatior TaxID=103372 RepID=UPI0005810034|nr:PREDICTED: protein SLG1-like [Acromyrmex echinatior]